MEWWGYVLLVVGLVVIPSWAIWRNMSDGRGNNVKNTCNRGISGERGDEYRDL